MKTLEIIGENYFGKWTKCRTACRGIVINDGKILLSFEKKRDQYGIPGGGTENGETLKECCRREIAEEAGIVVSVGEELLLLNEYYGDCRYETHFFVCMSVGETERALTKREKQVGLVPKWLDIEDALSIFSKHQDYALIDEEKRGIYLREYMALKEFVSSDEDCL